jgi:hypothetical protein
MLDFPNSPTTGQIFSSGKGTFSWDGTKWVPVFAGALGDAPSDGTSYGRVSGAWARVINRAGDQMGGALLLNADPTAPLGATTKQYVDSKTAGIGGGLVAFNSYSSSQTITIPTGATKAMVELWGASGGSGGAAGSYAATSGGTGAGGFVRKFLTGMTAGNTLVLTIGAAGTAGQPGTASNPTNGGNGGSSTLASGTQSIGTLTAGGSPGTAGFVVTSTAQDGLGGAGGTASGGDFNLTGSPGHQCAQGLAFSAYSYATGPNNIVYPYSLGGSAGMTMYSIGALGAVQTRGASPGASGTGNPGNSGGCLIWWYA